ncbi:hypothetical protein GCM10023194_57080 [Planotetraspora phitsanulokensis]
MQLSCPVVATAARHPRYLWGTMPQERDDRNIPLADRRAEQEAVHDEPDFAEEFTPSPTDPAGQPETDPDKEVHGQDEGYEKPTSA